MNKTTLIAFFIGFGGINCHSQLIAFKEQQGYYNLNNAAICVDANDFALVKKSADKTGKIIAKCKPAP